MLISMSGSTRSFLALPPEIRTSICQYHFLGAAIELEYTDIDDHEVNLWSSKNSGRYPEDSLLTLLQLNRKIRQEALPVFYEHTVLGLSLFGKIDTAPDASTILGGHCSGIQTLRMHAFGTRLLQYMELPSPKLLILDLVVKPIEGHEDKSLRGLIKLNLDVMQLVAPSHMPPSHEGREYRCKMFRDENRTFDIVVPFRNFADVCFCQPLLLLRMLTSLKEFEYRSVDTSQPVAGLSYDCSRIAVSRRILRQLQAAERRSDMIKVTRSIIFHQQVLELPSVPSIRLPLF